MFRSLPVNALRTFEAAARHLSFKAAADELAVTSAAVSHQIRSLEEWLGVALFERLSRGVQLTSKGASLFDTVHSAFLDIAQLANNFRPVLEPSRITVSVAPSFAALWLIPRLDRFYAANPHIQLSLDATASIVDLYQDASVDVAIRYGSSDHAGLYCAGRIAETFGVYGSPERVKAAASEQPVLINVKWAHSTIYETAWRDWCEAARVDWSFANAKVRSYAEELYAFQAAIAGQGLVLASSIVSSDGIRSGLLVPYRPNVTVGGGTYSIVCVPGRERHAPVRAFFAWLTKELQAEPLPSPPQE